MVQKYLPIICLWAVLALAGCATTSEPFVPDSTPKPAVVAEPDAPPTKTEMQVIESVKPENSVFFEQGSSEIDDSGRATLRLHADRLKANPKMRVTLIGRAESFGSRSMSIALADKRVSVVYAQLRAYGVPPRQLLRANVGIEKNNKACQSPECRRLMRRVELRYAKGRYNAKSPRSYN